MEHLVSLAETAREIRAADKSLAAPDEKTTARFNRYLHRTGVEALRLQPPSVNSVTTTTTTVATSDLPRDDRSSAVAAAYSRLGRLIKVEHLEEHKFRLLIDNEWNTRFWSVDTIEAACQTLVCVFSDPILSVPSDQKDRALDMLVLLMDRHKVADYYIQQSIENFIGKISIHTVRNGRSIGLLDLVYILHRCRERFADDLSRSNYCGSILELLMLEARLASTIIQNSYRVNKERRKRLYYISSSLLDDDAFILMRADEVAAEAAAVAVTGASSETDIGSSSSHVQRVGQVGLVMEGFGHSEELDQLRDGVILGRIKLLRSHWRNLRAAWTKSAARQPVSRRGVAHVPLAYQTLMLETILSLVSSSSTNSYATSNQDMIIQCHGEVLLAQLLAGADGEQENQANLSLAILVHVASIEVSYRPLLRVEIVLGSLKYLRAMQRRLHASGEATDDAINGRDREAAKARYFLKLVADLIYHLGIHEASHYPFAAADAVFASTTRDSSLAEARGFGELVHTLVDIALVLTHLGTMKAILRCFVSLSCSHCQDRLITAMSSNASRLLLRLVQLLEEQDTDISVYVTFLLVQCCAMPWSRELLRRHIPLFLRPLIKSTSHYNRAPYQRAMLVASALCRGPQERVPLPLQLLPLLYDPANIHNLIYANLLRSIKGGSTTTAAESASSSVTATSLLQWTELVPQPDGPTVVDGNDLSEYAQQVGAKELCDYFSHPHDPDYSQSLSWEQLTGSCAILQHLTAREAAASDMYSYGSTLFLIKAFYQARYQFQGRRVSNRDTVLLLRGVTAAAQALSHICRAGRGRVETVKDIVRCINKSECSTDFMEATCFFLRTLSTASSRLSSELRQLQVQLASAIIAFYSAFASMIFSLIDNADGNSSISSVSSLGSPGRPPTDHDAVVERCMNQLMEPGRAVTSLMISFKRVGGEGSALQLSSSLLDKICELLVKLTMPKSGITRAYVDWNISGALQAHIPSSSTAASAAAVAQLPISLFQLCINFCQLDDGKALCLDFGFLRRAIQKLLSLGDELVQQPPTLSTAPFNYGVRRVLPAATETRRDAVVLLQLVMIMAHYHHRLHGNANDLIFSCTQVTTQDASVGSTTGEASHTYPSAVITLCRDILLRNCNRPVAEPLVVLSAVRSSHSGGGSSITSIREDELIVRAVEALAVLSRERAQFSVVCELLDLLQLCANELSHVDEYPLPAVEAFVEMIRNVAAGPKSPYVCRNLRLFRKPLLHVLRLHGELEPKIRDCNWMITELSRGGGQLYQSLPPTLVGVDGSTQSGRSNHIDKVSDHAAATATESIKPAVSPTEKITTTLAAEAAAVAVAGTYLACGVSTCGSLRVPAEGVHSENNRQKLGDLSAINRQEGLCDLSRLSARDSKLQRIIAHRKARNGIGVDKAGAVADAVAKQSRKARKLSEDLERSIQMMFTTIKTVEDYSTATGESPVRKRAMNAIPVVTVEELPELLHTRPPPPKQIHDGKLTAG